MKRQAARIASIAGMTCGESLRQPLTMLLLIAAIVLSVLPPLLLVHPLGDARQLARDTALAVHFVTGLTLAIYLAVHAFEHDRQRGTTALLLAKPLARSDVYFGRLAGVCLVLLLFSVDLSICTLVAERIATRLVMPTGVPRLVCDVRLALSILSVPALACAASFLRYRRTGRSFAGGAIIGCSLLLPLFLALAGCFDRTGCWAPYALRTDISLLAASALIVLALIVLAAIATAIATRLSTVPLVTLMAGIVLLGLLSADPLMAGTLGNRPNWLAALLPNWQNFWIADALQHSEQLPRGYLRIAALHGACLVAAATTIGLRLFKRADVG